ncbi:MAG: hypothetical protein KAY32_15410 [Candidatus Eisenbacteria sp.]|nr:hypothetical protein [Candidatus Eisenbacteria bacterium]
MNETELAYIAGFLDGDGCLGIYYGSALERYYVQVRAYSCNPEVPAYLHKTLGGKVTKHKQSARSLKNGSDLYVWRICGIKAQEVIRLIKPYMIEKQVQADCITQFPFVKRPREYHTESDLQLMGELRDKIRFFNSNKGGKHD